MDKKEKNMEKEFEFKDEKNMEKEFEFEFKDNSLDCVDNPFEVDDLGVIDCYDLGISPWGDI